MRVCDPVSRLGCTLLRHTVKQHVRTRSNLQRSLRRSGELVDLQGATGRRVSTPSNDFKRRGMSKLSDFAYPRLALTLPQGALAHIPAAAELEL